MQWKTEAACAQFNITPIWFCTSIGPHQTNMPHQLANECSRSIHKYMQTKLVLVACHTGGMLCRILLIISGVKHQSLKRKFYALRGGKPYLKALPL
jgi:hypothetical protein